LRVLDGEGVAGISKAYEGVTFPFSVRPEETCFEVGVFASGITVGVDV
jgi:hypothetical protein